ncbi:MAG: hypothetical protein ISS79_08260 [Phycisphaerae bacterium]|nr:hypothetical protein [Phycisphaerae bacterium]
MKTTQILAIWTLALGLMVLQSKVGEAGAVRQKRPFTYQGELRDVNGPVTGQREFAAALFDGPVEANQLGDTFERLVEVADGRFTLELDFAPDTFNGDRRWLEISILPPDSVDPYAYTVLEPRTELTSTPYALYAYNASVYAPLIVSGSEPNSVIEGINSAFGSGVKGENERSGNFGSLGRGYEGVYGESSHGSGVFGKSTNGRGVRGSSENGDAVYGFSTNGDGLSGMTMSNTGRGVYGYCGKGSGVRGQSESGDGVYGFAGTGNGVYGQSLFGYGVIGLSDSNDGLHGTSENGNGVSGLSDTGTGVYGESENGYGVFGVTILDDAVHGESWLGYGVSGHSDSNDGVSGLSESGYGVYGVSDVNAGVCGRNSDSGNYGWLGTRFDGVRGVTDEAIRSGVSGWNTATGASGELGRKDIGVYGCNTGTGYAGQFDGKVHIDGDVVITGSLSKGSGSFRIDHPLDPKNRYLTHSFVESPDMMNVYNGNAVLDESGQASVGLPAYFEALNRDFRYQLTAIGAPGPNLYVAKKISKNRFRIAGGKPGMEVSWQVTGVRKDPYAVANRIGVEEDKAPEDRGYYLHPTAYGLPQERGIEFTRNRLSSETQEVAKGS